MSPDAMQLCVELHVPPRAVVDIPESDDIVIGH